MGGNGSKRSGSVDITSTPKKGQVENGATLEGGRLEKIQDSDVLPPATQQAKVAANGTAPHTDAPSSPQEAPLTNGDASPAAERKEDEEEEPKTPETAEAVEPRTPVSPTTDESVPVSPLTDDQEAKEEKTTEKKKKKDKKKWSFRSISFSKKDKSKPNVSKNETKNGAQPKGEALPEVTETTEAAVASSAAAASTLAEETTEAAASVPTPVAEPVPTPATEPTAAKETKETVEEAPKKEEVKEESSQVASAPAPVAADSVPVAEVGESSPVQAAIPTIPEPTPPTPVQEVLEPVHVEPPVQQVESAPIVPDSPVVENVVTPSSPVDVTPTPVEVAPAPIDAAPTPVDPAPSPVVPAPVAEPESTVIAEVTPTEPIIDVPPPLPASPPPAEVAVITPPESPVPSPPADPQPEQKLEPDLPEELIKEETTVCEDVGGGGESMAELVSEEDVVVPPAVDIINQVEENLPISDLPLPPPLVNGITNDNTDHKVIDEPVVADKGFGDIKTPVVDNAVADIVNQVSQVVSQETHTNQLEE